MDEDRNSGVTEARFGLTLLICLLVAIGYVALLRLGGTGNSTIEVRPGVEPEARNQSVPDNDDQPRVLKVEPQLAERPGPAHRDGTSTPSTYPVLPDGSIDSQRR